VTDETCTENDAPFFIVGNDRSGTTMLRLILDRGAQVSVPTESMFLADLAPIRRGALDLSIHANAVTFAQTVWNHPKVVLWGLDGPAPTPPHGLTHAAAYRFAVEAPYRALAAREGKTRFGDKTPAYLPHIDELLAVWPAAKFVVLVRDGRDVALSIAALPFGANNTWAAARDWAAGIRLGLRAKERHPASVLIVRYEDLVAQPREQVESICAFLGLEFVPDMLAVEKAPPGKLVADQAAWFSNLWAGINQSSVGKWRSSMSPRKQAVFLAEAGAELAVCGYDLGPNDSNLPSLSPARVAWYRLQDAALRLKHFYELRIVQERGRELSYVLRRKLGRL